MTNNIDYYRRGAYATFGQFLLEGMLAIGAFIFGRQVSKEAVFFFILFWFAGIISNFAVKPETDKGRFYFVAMQAVENTVLAVWIAMGLRSTGVLLMIFFLQWLTSLLIVNKRVVDLLVILQFVVYCSFHLIPGINESFTPLEMVGGTIVLIIGNWAAKTTIELIQMRDQLNHDQAQSLDDMLKVIDLKYNEAKASNMAKSNFLANMSHEIRTPINTVLGLDTMILRESDDDSIKEYALNIQSAGRSLLSIINDILDFSKIESGKMEIIDVDYDVSSLINDEINMISGKAKAKGLEFIVEVDPNIPSRQYGDDVRIRQVLTNLLTNAVKYTEKGKVTLSITCDILDDVVHMHYAVKDSGIGIKEEDLDKLFEKFVRIEEKRNRNIEGTGLGMNIVSSLLYLMDSSLQVTSEYGQGSTFYFDIVQPITNYDPVGDFNARITAMAEDYEYEAKYTAPDARLLVVDDNSMNRVVFIALLKEIGCLIDEAASGFDAIDLVQKNSYDIIFMDHMMPEMDGIETFHKIQEMSPEQNKSYGAPMIILTANAIAGARDMYLEEGFDDFLSKPIAPDKLEKMIFDILPKELIQKGKKKQGEKKNEPSFDLDKLPKIEGVDWNFGYLHLPSEEMLFNTVKGFYTMIDAEADYLATQYGRIVAAGDDLLNEDGLEALDLFRIKVHAVKSSATLFGAFALAGQAASLEYASRDGRRDFVIDVTPHFLEDLRSYKEKLKPMAVGEEEEAPKEEIKDINMVYQAISELEEAINVFDVHGADSALEKIRVYEYSSEVNDILDKIAAAVMNLDPDMVTSLCEEMKEKVSN